MLAWIARLAASTALPIGWLFVVNDITLPTYCASFFGVRRKRNGIVIPEDLCGITIIFE